MKIGQKFMKKILPYILIFVILAGLFSPIVKVSAQAGGAPISTTNLTTTQAQQNLDNAQQKLDEAEELGDATPEEIKALETARDQAQNTLNTLTKTPTSTGTADNEFQKQIDSGCSLNPLYFDLGGCVLKLFYYTYFMIPTFVLWLSAQFFNFLIPISLDSTMIMKSEFIPQAWGVVRDVSNIFFILVLLYIAIQTILGMGHETKKMIAQVVIMALLINFSMFFTEVVIDSSNVLALIFYNKLDVNKSRPNESSTASQKDISGEIYRNFDVTTLLTKENLDKFKSTTINGKIYQQEGLPFGATLGLMLIAGTIMLFAAYTFFIAGFSFLGRLVELWILIIFSPFALMSSTLPILEKINYVGWKSWLEKLLATSFMAPIFMFFLYFIFLLLPHMSGFVQGDGAISMILTMLIPALLLLALLLKATHYAKKGSGYFGEILSKGGEALAGMAIGAATGGAAALGRATVGKAGAAMANSGWAKDWEAKHIGGEYAMSAFKKIGSASFDARASSLGKNIISAGGLDVGTAQKGGFTERREADIKKRMERAKEIEVGEDEKLKQELNAIETDLQDLLRGKSHELGELDKKIKSARQAQLDTAGILKLDPGNEAKTKAAKEASDKFQNLLAEKKSIKTATKITSTTGKVFDGDKKENRSKNGRTIDQLEDEDIPTAKHEIETENRTRRWNYAQKLEGRFNRGWNFVFSGGQYSYKGAEEASHKIRMEAKIPSGGGDHGGGHGGGGGHAPKPATEHKEEHKEEPKEESHGGGHGSGGGDHGTKH